MNQKLMAFDAADGGFLTPACSDGSKRLDQLIPRPCSMCGKDMMDYDQGITFIAQQISVDVDGVRIGPGEGAATRAVDFYKRQLGGYAPMLEIGSPLKLEICWECYLKALGVLVPDQQFEVTNNDG